MEEDNQDDLPKTKYKFGDKTRKVLKNIKNRKEKKQTESGDVIINKENDEAYI